MTLYQNNAEGLSSGTTIAASQSGSGNVFSNVTFTGSPLGVYDNASFAHGTQSYHLSGVSGDIVYMRFDGGGVTAGAVRAYIRLNALPSGALNFIEMRDTSGQQNAAVGMNSSGKIQIKDAAGTALITFATALSVGTWYRVEIQMILGASTSTGTISGAYYAGDSATALDTTYSSTVVNSGVANNTFVRYGKLTSSTSLDMNLDDLAWNNGSASAIGAVSTNQPPTCSAGTDQTNLEPYITVTLTGTDADSDGSVVTRLWRQVSGTPAVTLTGTNTATATYISPGTIAGTNLIFGYSVIDNSGAVSSENTVSHTILSVTERAVMNGVEVPVHTQVVSGGGLV